jgi:uncharacterized protein involved in cysteine biosynthesis
VKTLLARFVLLPLVYAVVLCVALPALVVATPLGWLDDARARRRARDVDGESERGNA